MDDETRGAIEKTIDEGIANLNLEKSAKSFVEWMINDIVILDKTCKDEDKSVEDLAVGYVIGYLMRVAHEFILERIRKDKLEDINNRIKDEKLSDIEREKKMFIVNLYVKSKDTREIREIIHSRVGLIREEVIKALNV